MTRITIWRGRIQSAGLVFVMALLSACALPLHVERPYSSYATDTQQTRLAQWLAQQPQAQNKDKNGLYPLRDGYEAFAARAIATRAAEKTLDVQYYIWHADTTGKLLIDELLAAAKRGVRVRLLLDDNNTGGMDALLLAVDAHPNVEVRLFNPFAQRQFRALGYLTDFQRLNRRMHNKSWTADGQLTIIGGRNVGDEYFEASPHKSLFQDFDVALLGPAARDVSRDFDRYWNHAAAYPVDQLLASGERLSAAQLAQVMQDAKSTDLAKAYSEQVRKTDLVQLTQKAPTPQTPVVNATKPLQLEWVNTEMISDPPNKIFGQAPKQDLFYQQLRQHTGAVKQRLDLISAYFVPLASGTQMLTGLSKNGVQVRILTNALEASDVPFVHAGYMKQRPALLDANVGLWEYRQQRGSEDKVSLHAKTFAIDQRLVFVGSFNFDPRSAQLNTELGFLIHSPQLAKAVHDYFGTQVAQQAYHLSRNENGKMQWQFAAPADPNNLNAKENFKESANEILVWQHDPNSNWLKRAMVKFFSWLPIDWLL